MFSFKYLVLLSAVVHYGDAALLPTYMERCCVGPSFNECALKNANEALPAVIQGSKYYNIPNFFPLILGKVELLNNEDGCFEVRDVRVSGFSFTKVLNATIDMTTGSTHVRYMFPRMLVKSTYDMNLTCTPAVGFGSAEIVLRNVVVDHKFRTVIDGDGYPRAIKPTVRYTVASVSYRMSNMPEAGNHYLNHHGNRLHTLFAPMLSTAMSDAFTTPYAAVGDMVQVTDLFNFNCSAQ